MNTDRKSLDHTKYLNRQEVKRLRKAVEDKALADLSRGRQTWVRNCGIIELVLHTGLRVQEVADVKIKDLDLNAKMPMVRVNGKGGKSGIVHLDDKIRKHLKHYLSWRTNSRGEKLESEDYLFFSKKGRKMSTRALQHVFKKALEVANLPSYYSFHSMRHSYGTYLYEKTRDLRLVQKQLRHSRISTTQIYADITPENMAKGVNGIWKD
jgi:site-specific recombinase XerD